MKNLLTILVCLVFFAASPIFVSADKPAKEEKVYCCHGKGNCDKIHGKAECEKEGGKVVKSCKECK
jgi:hypothetical protein